ncbi:hypothetical protein [Streptomyces chrestomyceticus]|uniref:hypothetical protein n=1 Tax=Streptomyces chrestomyceticus TaxID=68185 RepID=UPI0033CCD40E
MTAILEPPLAAPAAVELEPVSFEVHDRRRPGEAYPRIPAGWVELTRAQAAAALFESFTEDAAYRRRHRHTDAELCAILADTTDTLGARDLDRIAREFTHLDLTDPNNGDVVECWELAHRLTVAYWFTNAHTRPMNRYEVAVALYLAGDRLPRRRQEDYRKAPCTDAQISALVEEFAPTLHVDDLRWNAQGLRLESAPPTRSVNGRWEPLPLDDVQQAQRDGMRRALPDYHRRRFCLSIAEGMGLRGTERFPLVVEPADGEPFLGPVVGRAPERCLFELARRYGRQRGMELAAEASA